MSSLGLGYMPKDINGWVGAGAMLDTSAKEGIFKPTRLVIVDRQPIVLLGLKSVLGAQPDFDVVASCSDGTSCIQALRSLTPDIALLADTLPDLPASEILAIAKAESLPTRLVFFTESDAHQDLSSAMAAGACDTIAKHAAPDAILRSLRLVTKRSVLLQQSELSPIATEADGGKIENLLELLTPRERQIVRLVSEGMSNKEIAHQLNVSNGTVKVHLHNIFQKLEITNRTVLATLALLQRSSGFGMLALALLAVAVADELKASEANDTLPDDDRIGPAVEHGEYELWKRAILRHVVVADSDEKPAFHQRDVFAEASQISIAASAMEALRSAEQSAGSTSWKDYSSVGSSMPDLAAPSLRGMKDAHIGGDPTAEYLLSRLKSNPMLIHAQYGFVALTGALIHVLSDPHLALLSHDPAKATLDSLLGITAAHAATKLAAITNADDHHADNSVPGFLAHESRLPSAFVTTENESVAAEGARSHMSDGTGGKTLQKLAGFVHFAHDADSGGYGRDQLMGGAENAVHRSRTGPNSTSSDSVFNFAAGPGRINLAAFGALAWVHLTAASKSIPPHTLAWIFNSASNETIVYVNPTDHVLKIGDRGLLEIHLQGAVSIAESDLVGHPTGAAAAITLEQLEEALTSVTATETDVSTDSAHRDIGTSESTLGTAEAWDILTGIGSMTGFAPARTGLGGTSRFGASIDDSARARDESVDGAGGSTDVSPIVLAHAATVTAAESLTAAGSAGGGNSQDVLKPLSANETGAGLTETGFIPGKDDGDEDEHQSPASAPSGRSATAAAADGVEHGKPVHSTSADAPEAAEIGESSSATADRGEREKSQHAPEQNSARGPARDAAEAKAIPGHRADNDNESSGPAKVADPGGLDHSNLHTSERGSAAAETAKAKATPDDGAGNDNEHHSLASDGSSGPAKMAEPGLDHSNVHASERGSASAETAKAKATPGDGAGNDGEHHSQTAADMPGSAKMAEPSSVEHSNKGGHSTPGHGPEADESVAMAGGADRGSTQHAAEPEPAKAAATTELAETDLISGKGAGDGADHRAPSASVSAAVTAAKLADPQHGNSDHNLPPTSANASAATEIAESSAAKGDSAGNGNSQHATQSAAIASVAAEPAKAALETGGVDQEPVFRFDSDATPLTAIAAVEPEEVHIPLAPHDQRGQAANPDILVKILPDALDEHVANHGNNGPHHANAPAPHDLLI